ncbi:MAG: transglycosylase, partial [Phenylobacterium sp.]
FPTYQRLVTALDTGGAIRGPIRADLYLGQGPEAGLEAGRIRHVLRLYRLVPRP